MRNAALLALCTTLALLAGPARAQPLPQARPEQVGLSSERLGQVGRVLREEIEKGKFPGAVALVARKGRIAVGGMDFAQSNTSNGTASADCTRSPGKPCLNGGATLAPDSLRTADTNK